MPGEAEGDLAIVAAVQATDTRRAFGLLVERFQREIHRFCFHMLRNPTDAADAAQETFEAALQALDGFRGEASLRTWIFGIARRRCIDRLRKHTRRKTEASDEMDVHADERPLQDERFHEREGARALQELIGDLPEIDQSILLLRFDHGLSFHEIGVTLGMRGDTAKVRAHRALVRLRPLLEKRGFGR